MKRGKERGRQVGLPAGLVVGGHLFWPLVMSQAMWWDKDLAVLWIFSGDTAAFGIVRDDVATSRRLRRVDSGALGNPLDNLGDIQYSRQQ